MIEVLKNKNFFLLFSGRFITNIGDSIYSVASMWLVFEITGSSLYTGIAGGLILLPSIFEFLVGPLVDRWNLRSIMVYTQLIQAFLISLIPILYYLGYLNVWLIILIMFLASCIEQIVYPTHQAAIPKILEKKDLVVGNSLMTFAYQGTDIVFIGLSGLLIASIGVINIFIIDIFTFLVACLLFRGIKIHGAKTSEEKQSLKIKDYFMEIEKGRNFIFNSIISKFIFPISIVNLIFGMITAILPEYSYYIGGEQYYGYFLATMSVAMLSGAVFSKYFSKYPIGVTTIIGFFISAVAWFLSYWTKSPYLTIFFFGIAFIPISIINILITSALQVLIPEGLIGKVIAWYSSITALFVPVGSFIGGFVASVIGISNIYALGSLGLLSISLYWICHPKVRKMPNQTGLDSDEYRYMQKNEQII